MNVLLDTATWINSVEQPKQLPANILAIVRDRKNSFYVSGMSLLEASTLERKKRIDFKMPFPEWLDLALAGITVLPITAQIASIENQLPKNFHGDPADRIIVATAKAHGLILLTPDPEIEFHEIARTRYYKWRAT